MNMKFGTVEGTGAAINVQLGWVPDFVLCVNRDDAGTVYPVMIWFRQMTDGHALKFSTSAHTFVTSNGISEYAGAASASLTGTVAVTAGANTVTGTSSAFLTEVKKGDIIRVTDTGESRLVRDVLSDTSLTVFDDWDTTDASSAATNETGAKAGFTIGADSDMNADGETIFYMAGVSGNGNATLDT